MANLTLTLTQAGINAVLAADQNGLQAEITDIAFGDTGWTPTAAATSLHNERARVAVSGGEEIGGNQLHLTATEDGSISYWVREIGIYLSDGTLLAIWSHASETLAYKSVGTDLVLAFDLLLTAVPASSVTISGSGGFSLPAATTAKRGVVEIATDAEATAGTAIDVVVTPKHLKDATSGVTVPTATTSRSGTVELATNTEARSGNDTTRVVTPKHLGDATPAASDTVSGLVRLATDAEMMAGTATDLAITPAQALNYLNFAKAEISGGTVTADATHTYFTFTTSGILTISNSDIVCATLIIAGGGGGGNGDAASPGGGGGGGGRLFKSESMSVGSYPILVGAGGIAFAQGGNSTFFNRTAIGGGHGSNEPGGGGYAGIPTTGQGHRGGNAGSVVGGGFGAGGAGGSGGGGSNTNQGSGGGGGAGGAGGAGVHGSAGNGSGGAGGIGAAYTSWASATSTGDSGYYAGGGGGSTNDQGNKGVGGFGGGGNGGEAKNAGSNGIAGEVNTGGGGGGGADQDSGYSAGTGGNGGAGIVIIRVLTSDLAA